MDKKISKKEIFKLIGINILLFILLFGLVTINKQVFRPTFNHSDFAIVMTGSFPNFIAAYLISLCVVNPVLIKKPKHGKYIVYISSFLIFAIFTIEELIPMWGASTTFDTFDIIASGLGSIFAILTFELLMKERKKEKTPYNNV